ncbi:hypothetical protein LSCM1_06705 [Leishmania martiniquensis]|uniref:Uncharacterized protein n=1 Tax=Leishmania martiniquensis TaxID=1580590 RepID=A0A836GXP5_9TRYP|nr:hypothetical protein LSCM1_06705 [Leishmania martiniquensis]
MLLRARGPVSEACVHRFAHAARTNTIGAVLSSFTEAARVCSHGKKLMLAWDELWWVWEGMDWATLTESPLQTETPPKRIHWRSSPTRYQRAAK